MHSPLFNGNRFAMRTKIVIAVDLSGGIPGLIELTGGRLQNIPHAFQEKFTMLASKLGANKQSTARKDSPDYAPSSTST